MLNKFILLMFLAFSVIMLSCADSSNNPTDNSELKIISTFPSVDNSLESIGIPLEINFDNKIQSGNLSIRLFDYDEKILVEKILVSNIHVKDSSISFYISKNLVLNKKYYILLDSGSIKYGTENLVYSGYKDRNIWAFVYEGLELKIREIYPLNNTQLLDYKKPFKISFDNKIYKGNISVKIVDFDNLNVIEEINQSMITFGDSSFSFTITSKLPENKQFSILIGHGSVTYSDKKIPFIGINSKLVWSFKSPRVLPENNTLTASISGAYSYQFICSDKEVKFSYFDNDKTIVSGGFNQNGNKHQITLVFKINSGSNDVYSLTSGLVPSSFTVSIHEEYESNSTGTIKVTSNNEKYFEGTFNFTAKLKNSQESVNISNGYIFVYK